MTESKFHFVDVEMDNGMVLNNVEVVIPYKTCFESEVVDEFFKNMIFKHKGTWFPVTKVIKATYAGVNPVRHTQEECLISGDISLF